MPALLNQLSRRTRRLLFWGVGLVGGYTLFGFLILPPIVRAVAVKSLSKELNREVAIEKVRLNPYALSGSILGLRINDLDGETLLGWDQAYANFQLASFLGRPWVFSSVSVSNPVARVQVNKNYTLNFSDLLEKFAKANVAKGAAKPSAKPLALRVDQLHIVGARVVLADLTPRQPFRRVIGPVEIALKDFHTDPNSRNPYSFTGSSDSGEVFAWSGNFSINPVRADGELSVTNVSLNKFAPLYEDLVRFEIRDGIASFGAAYRFVKSETTNIVAVTNAFMALRSFKLGESGAAENLLELPEFGVSGVSGDLMARAAVVDSVSVRGASLNIRRAKDESLNFVEAAKPNDTVTNAPGSILFLLRGVTKVFSMLLESTNALTGLVRNVAVENCAVSLRDDVPSTPVRLNLEGITLSAHNLSNLPGTNLTASVSLRWNTNGTVKTDLTASLFPLSADLGVALEQVELNPLNPYLGPYVNVFILGSKLGLDGQVRLRAEPGQLPVVTFKGNSRLDEFSTVDGVKGEDLLKWGSLRFEGIEASMNPPAVSVAAVKLADCVARVALETNHVLNVLAILGRANTNTDTAAPEAPARSTVGGTKVSAKAAFTQLKQALGNRTNALTQAGLPQINVAAIEITNTDLQFADRSVAPPVLMSLQQLHGDIQDISSEELRHAQIHLSGRVNNTGPVELSGHFNPLHQQQTSEVSIIVKDVELNPADPYSAKFLGYRLAKGKVNVDVGCQMSARQLKGRNLIMLDQFTLGEKVNSPDATKLPVRLGIALLKDRSGKIELDVPVEGNLDDPEFKLGHVIWHVIANVFTKAITSPFALLGSLFGGGKGEELQFQDFEPGRTELLIPSRDKLDTMVKALHDRPGLQVEIEGHTDPVADRDALRRLKLDEQLRLQKRKALTPAQREATSLAEITLTPEERAALLRAIWLATPVQTEASPGSSKTALAAEPATPVILPPGAPTQLPRAAARDQIKGAEALFTRSGAAAPRRETAPPDQMELQLLEIIDISVDELQALASERAKRVQDYLVQPGRVEAARVLLTEPSQGSTYTNGTRVYLQLR
jgi:hypothetical protein